MKNTIILQGLKISTNYKFVKFTKSTTTKVVTRVAKSTLEVLFVACRKSSDIVSSEIELVEDVVLEETPYIEIKNPIYRINDFYFRKIIPSDIIIEQYIVEDISQFLVYKNKYQLTILIPTNRLQDFKGYIQAVTCSGFLEYLSADTCPVLANVAPLYLGGKNLCFNSKNTYSIKTVDAYSKYLVQSVDVFYAYLSGLESRLKSYGMDLLGYPISENPATSNYIRWKLVDKDKQIQRKTGYDFLNHTVQCKAIMEMEVCFSDMEMCEDFVFKYQNLEFISNYTEWYVKDKIGNLWLCSAFYDPLPTQFDTTQASNAEGNFSYSQTFTVNLYYYIVKDTKVYEIHKVILDMVAKSSDPLNNTILKF